MPNDFYKRLFVRFRDFLRECRESSSMTQEELVLELYQFDLENFSNLDTTTLSRWERGVTQPNISKQISLVKFFQALFHTPFPCTPSDENEIEKKICKNRLADLFLKNKKLVLNFPSSMMTFDNFEIYELREYSDAESVIDIHAELDRGFHNRFEKIGQEKMKRWAMHPSNRFFICLYKGQFFGFLFSLSLKKDIFEKVMHFEMDETEITTQDFVTDNDTASSYVLSFFSMNEKAASALFIRYDAYLLAQQKVLESLGTTVIMDEAKSLVERIELDLCCSKEYKEGTVQVSYKKNLFDFVASKSFLKLVFQKEECEEE